MKAISKGSLAGCLVHMDASSTDYLAFVSMLMIGHYPAGFFIPAYLSETDQPQVTLMPFWLLPYPLNPTTFHSSLTTGAAR